MTMQDWAVSKRWAVPRVATALVSFEPKKKHDRVPGLVTEIIRDVADAWTIKVEHLTGPSRERRVAWARFEAVYRIRTECPWMSLPMIGKRLGGRDHTSCIHAMRRYPKLAASGEIEIVRLHGNLSLKARADFAERGKAPRETRQEEEGTSSLNLGAAPNNEA